MEASKKALDNIKKYKPTVSLWSSVRIKFIVIIVTILLVVIASVAMALAIAIIRPYKDLLSNSLLLQTKILLDNLELRVQTHFSNPNQEDLDILLLNRVTFPEAKYVVVTGKSSLPGQTGLHYVLATDYQDITKVINTHRYIPGESQFYPEGIEEILQKLTYINSEATLIVHQHIDSIQLLMDEMEALDTHRDPYILKRQTEIQASIRHLEAKLQSNLSALADQGFGSYPDYSIQSLSKKRTEYLFYEPIIYYNPDNPQECVQGIVFVNISVEGLLEKINDQQNRLIRIIAKISLIVLIAGISTAWFLSSLFVRPLGLLAAHVALIRDTEDKEKLAGRSVQVTSRDEFGMLGTTINDMTERLAAAAAISKDLKVGKEIQKMFIPLDLSSSGRKLTTGSHRDVYSEFFGYYEGAHGVSGDYFDYRKLDAFHYAVIKCDVAGKGVPAALIMVEVATLFQSYFQNWNYKRDGYNLSTIVMRINDVIESHGFVGRFAAFSLCIINMRVGDAYFCNAGDNIVHIYDKQARRLKSYTLRSGSAAGVFSSEMISLNGGYPIEKIHLNCGDILFLYTDGIEESKRKLRVPISKPKNDSAAVLPEDKDDNSHLIGTDSETLGKDRVEEIIEAVFARKKFTLKKRQSDLMYEQMDFDFSSCNGTIEDAVLALISVEKAFRMYKDSSAQSFDCVQVDKKIDAFLSKCFLQYDIYCCDKAPHPIYDEYFYYKQIKEDIQYDDLTILGIARRVPV
ncbi:MULTISPECIES: SpoIIE family protein phosphatase [unclassified Treponema]|uniref:SpoIIE family protein phosphatase n=1 Tax=unclassified Treponema TaxID=2638727 RepID=UPI0005300D4E|nr:MULTISPECIES: SpoIIE family protein phosphatase [unclassified Treponema]AIW88978.1 histidine kinase [Treponema sp. OMZ 838]UTC51072.1 SpoIIE family protein phosphatase [Treponema sp. OMZ 855]